MNRSILVIILPVIALLAIVGYFFRGFLFDLGEITWMWVVEQILTVMLAALLVVVGVLLYYFNQARKLHKARKSIQQ